MPLLPSFSVARCTIPLCFKDIHNICHKLQLKKDLLFVPKYRNRAMNINIQIRPRTTPYLAILERRPSLLCSVAQWASELGRKAGWLLAANLRWCLSFIQIGCSCSAASPKTAFSIQYTHCRAKLKSCLQHRRTGCCIAFQVF